MTHPGDLPVPQLVSAPRCVWPEAARLGEGTLWSRERQSLYWVDILGHRLHRYTPAADRRESWDFEEEVSAVSECADGQGLVMSLRHTVVRFDPDAATPALTTLQPADEPASNRFNDGKCDAQGRFWVGSMDFDCVAPTGSLYSLEALPAGDPSGAWKWTRHATGFAVSNGPTWSADGRTMFFNDTVNAAVLAFDFDPHLGQLSGRREWLRFAPGDGFPDGMTTDAAGRLWIAHWGAACVSCHDPRSGNELCRISLPASHITDCAFGGPDLRTLYISSATSGLSAAQREAEPLAGGLFAVELDVAGIEPHRFGKRPRG